MATANRVGTTTFTTPSDREIVMTRVVDAPRRLVFEAWTNPEHLPHWFGPRGWTLPVCEIDLRPGGAYHYVLRGPDGNTYAFSGVYREIVPPARLVCTWGWEAMPGHEALETVTFDERDGKTKMTMKTLFQSAGDLEGWAKAGGREGMAETLDRLAEHLETMTGLVITRVFDAPRDLVFKAWTEPQRLMRWWGPRGFTTPFCKVDLRPGGVFHYCMRSPEGRDYWGRGVYREIAEPERIVYLDSFADEEGNPVEPAHYGMSPGHPAETLVTVTFVEHEGKTKVTLHHSVPEAVPERSGIQQGWTEMLDRLAEELAKA